MFSMEEIGRKSRNMTQVNLADKLGITYQAVSSWERGNSMPDIEKLPEIAKLFEISIDELIGESKVVTMMLNTSEQDPENFEKLTEEDITEVLPILGRCKKICMEKFQRRQQHLRLSSLFESGRCE